MEKERNKTFEIVVAVLDSLGQDTGRRKSYASDSGYKIWEFYTRHVGASKHNKKKSKSKLPNAEESAKILKEVMPTE